MHAQYAASFGSSKIMHAIKAPWPHGDDASLTCGKNGKNRKIAYSPASDVEITCKTCIRLSPETPDLAPVKLASTRYAVRASREYPAKPNARQRRAQRRSGGYFARQYA